MDELLKAMKKKSAARKRHLRDMNEKLKLYQAIADAAISDAARWHKEAQYWKLLHEKEKDSHANQSQN
jgi:hypothetical protein